MEKQTNKKYEEDEEPWCGTPAFQMMHDEMEELKKKGYSKIGYFFRVIKLLMKYIGKL